MRQLVGEVIFVLTGLSLIASGCNQPRPIHGPVSVGIVESTPERTEATYAVCGSVQIIPDPGGKYTVIMTDVRMEYPIEDPPGRSEERRVGKECKVMWSSQQSKKQKR